MQKLAATTLGAGLLLNLHGCAVAYPPGELPVGDDMVFRLLSPASFGQQVILTQVVTLAYGDEKQELLFYSEIDAAAVTIAGLLPDGTRLFSVSYDGQSLQSEGNAEVLARLDPHYLLADMQIALWPLQEVRNGFASANACFHMGSCQLQETADAMARTLSKDGSTIIDVKYQGLPHYRFTTSYEHHVRDYSVHIETVDVELLDNKAQ